MAIPEFEEAFKRLAFQAEVGGWYKEDSTVPVRIGDLYAMFDKLKELNKAKELLLNTVNPQSYNSSNCIPPNKSPNLCGFVSGEGRISIGLFTRYV